MVLTIDQVAMTGGEHRQTQSARVLPYSLEAEQSVLGALILDNSAWDKVSDCVVARDFYRLEHRLIFEVIADLSRQGKPFDMVTLPEALKVDDKLDKAGGASYLYELSNNTPAVANIVHYADIIRERSVLRQLIQVSQEVADSAYMPEGRTVSELLDTAERKVFSIAEQTGRDAGPTAMKEWALQSVRNIETRFHSKNSIVGLSTGFRDLDEITSGLQPGDLFIVAGRPSMGKTSFAFNIAENIAISESKPVLVFSLEMPGEQLATRSISSLARINQQSLRTGRLEEKDFPNLISAANILSEAPMFIDDTPGLSPTELRARARRVAKEQGNLALIMVDYLQLMHIPGSKTENRTLEISEISRSLKLLAKELHTPVIALSQLNRSLEQRSDKRPVMSDLRESGAIEQDADLIAFIYRDEVYHSESKQKGMAEIIIAKQRNGPIGKVHLAFFGRYTRFEDLAKGDYHRDQGVNIDRDNAFLLNDES